MKLQTAIQIISAKKMNVIFLKFEVFLVLPKTIQITAKCIFTSGLYTDKFHLVLLTFFQLFSISEIIVKKAN